MSSWVHICPGCSGRFRDPQAFLWHTETCDAYAALPVDADPRFRPGEVEAPR